MPKIPTDDADAERRPEPCRACGGSGINSRGGACYPCQMTGRAKVVTVARADAAKRSNRAVQITERRPPP